MTTATQDVEDFLKNEYGKAVLTNSSIQILLKQGTAEVDMIANTFYLSEGEKALLLSSDVGEGLFFAGQNHVAMKVFAAPFEHELITSNPMELLKRQEDAAADKVQAQAEAASTAQAPAPSMTTDINKLLETPAAQANPSSRNESINNAGAVTQPESSPQPPTSEPPSPTTPVMQKT